MSRYFAGQADQPRVRRAADIGLLVVGLLLLWWSAANWDSVLALEQALIDLANAAPDWFEQTFQIIYFLGLLFIGFVLLTAIVQAQSRPDLLRDVVVALAVPAALGIGLSLLITGDLPLAFPEFRSDDIALGFPILRVAVVTSIAIVASPHLAVPMRRLGIAMVLMVAFSGFAIGLGAPGAALGGIAIGMVSGAGILVAFGSPKGNPDPSDVAVAAATLGLDMKDVEHATARSWGLGQFSGELADGRSADIKAYGRDATDSQMLSKSWNALWYREGGQTYTYSRLQAVEHEALAMLTAERAGVRTEEVLAVGVGGEDMALVVTTASGGPLQSSSDIEMAWQQVALLHEAGISHGALTVDAFTVTAGEVTVRDFTSASLAASDARIRLDTVSMLFASAVVLGVDVSVDVARRGAGDEHLIAALPFLQVPALTRQQRRDVDKPKAFVKQLRAAVADATGVELPEPAKLRRVRPKDLIAPALSLFAAYVLLGMLTDIDFVAVWDVVRDATWSWILVGFAVGQFVFFPEATAMLYATGYQLPLKPLVILQVSVKWIGLAIPSAAGRVTMNTLFLRKFGVPPTIALTQGALDGISGFVVEAMILVVAFLSADIPLDLDTSEIEWGIILAILIGLIAVSALAVLRIKRLRAAVLPVLKDAWDLLWSILKDPSRALGILFSNLASRTVLAIVLWFILHAIGAPLPLVTALVITVATNLLAGLVPIPGGIGVAEAVLTSFLILAGLGSEEAFAAAVVFRLATFYIPAGEGFFAMRWLEKNGHL